MIFLIILVGIVLVFLSFFSFYIIDKELCDFGIGLLFGMLIAMLSILEILMICDVLKVPQPHAIDVYRGNTELQIHSINNIPQDTVVVWKNN